MNLPDVAYKTSTALLGVATLVLTADLVHAMTREALFGKAQVKLLDCRPFAMWLEFQSVQCC